MNANDIFRKSALGHQEIKNQGQGVLPREVRTLLILIDGKKPYQHYIDLLDNSPMFADFGGVVPLFELLIDFQCIELVETESRTISAPSLDSTSTPTAPRPMSTAAVRNEQPLEVASDKEAEFEKTFNTQSSTDSRLVANTATPSYPDAHYEALKSELATHIEKNAPLEEAWGHLLNLEQCRNSSELLALARDIQNANSATLSRSMSEFFTRINRYL